MFFLLVFITNQLTLFSSSKLSIKLSRGNVVKKNILILAFIGFLSNIVSAKTPVAMNPLSAPDNLSSERQLIEEIMQAELSMSDNITLVDRESLRKALKEMQLSEQGMLDPASASKLGKIVGAKFFCTGKITQSGSKKMVIVKIIDVETTVAKLSYAVLKDKEDAVETGKTLAQNIEKLIAKHQADNKARAAKTEKPKAKPVPADWKRPVVMVVIPEMHIRQIVIDPAAETKVQSHRFRVCQSFEIKTETGKGIIRIRFHILRLRQEKRGRCPYLRGSHIRTRRHSWRI
jgi:TolB-like protein